MQRNSVLPRKGQFWRDHDRRFNRTVTVLDVYNGDTVMYQAVGSGADGRLYPKCWRSVTSFVKGFSLCSAA